jgi:uncharacterized membrane protein YeaQ/YmgE (transglycosylase-associated protein family)
MNKQYLNVVLSVVGAVVAGLISRNVSDKIHVLMIMVTITFFGSIIILNQMDIINKKKEWDIRKV